MVIVDAQVSNETQKRIDKEIANEPTQEEIEQNLLNNNEGEVVMGDVEFTKPNGKVRRGFYMDGYLKSNLDNYLIKAVKKKWDGVMLITGMEGSAKSTNAFSIAKYIDPTFPGEPCNDGTSRRKCDRIVFTPKQTLEAIDNAKKHQAIVMDEAVLNFLAQDASADVQKLLIKKMVTIRKKQLYIFIVIPSIFLLRKYIAIFRTRALIHFYSPDGFSRGYAKVYSYDTKRKLYVRGIKEFDQNCVKPDFLIKATDTSGFFFNEKEYQLKKDEAIKELTTSKDERKKEPVMLVRYREKTQLLIYAIYNYFKKNNTKWRFQDMVDWFKDNAIKHSTQRIKESIKDAEEILMNRAKEIEEKAKLDANIEKYKEDLKKELLENQIKKELKQQKEATISSN